MSGRVGEDAASGRGGGRAVAPPVQNFSARAGRATARVRRLANRAGRSAFPRQCAVLRILSRRDRPWPRCFASDRLDRIGSAALALLFRAGGGSEAGAGGTGGTPVIAWARATPPPPPGGVGPGPRPSSDSVEEEKDHAREC